MIIQITNAFKTVTELLRNYSMIMRTTKRLQLALVFLLGISSFGLQARIISVDGSNNPSQVSITMTGQSQIRWQVVEGQNPIGQATIRSTGGMFVSPSSDEIFGRTTTSLFQTRTLVGPGNTTFIFNESIVIPQSVIRNAQRSGFSQFLYMRTFSSTPDDSSLSNFVTFNITAGSAAGELSVRRVQMEFDDGRISSISAPNSKFQARAIISYSGTGLLEYTWEIATPPSTSGQATFFPLISRKQFLLSGDQVTLQSPNLPSIREGSYLLRLRIDKPIARFEMPQLHYAINRSAGSNATREIISMQTSQPAEGVTLAPETEFVWQKISGAKAYQLEVYAKPVRANNLPGTKQQAPITGVLIPATKTRIKIGSLSRTHLIVGTTYYWRVVALSDKGQVVGRSEFRSIQF